MTKRKRLTLIMALTILFLITAPLTIFYALGWRFDFKTGDITRPGIFFFKVKPNSVDIYLNGELEDKTDFFFGSAVIENLLPRSYSVKIEKEGFYSWEKTLEIKKGQITEAKNITLIPQDPSFEITLQNVESFYFSPDQKKIILKEKTEDSWSLKLFELGTKIKSQLAEEKDFSKTSSEIIDLQFSKDNNRIILKLSSGKSIGYFLLDVTTTKITSLDFLLAPEKVYFHPTDQNRLFSLKEGNLEEIDLLKEESSPLLKNILAFESENLLYLNKEGFLLKNNVSFDREKKINQNPLNIRINTEYEIKKPSNIFIKESNSLYLFYPEESSFKEMAASLKNFKISPDQKKIAYFNDFEVWLYFLEDTIDAPLKKKGDRIFITRLSESIGDIFWYTNHYLIFNSGNEIKIAETDDRDKISVVNLTTFPNPQIFWDGNDQKIYLLSEEKLYQSKDLIP